MATELDDLERNNTWMVTPLPLEKTMIGCKWIFKIKHNQDGSINRHKVWLVTKGYTQHEGINYTDTFSLKAKMTTIKTLLTITSSR